MRWPTSTTNPARITRASSVWSRFSNGGNIQPDPPPADEPCTHTRLDIDRTLCPCGFRHVYCVRCETRMDTDECPWIPDNVVFRAMMRHLWGGGTPE